MSAFKADVYMSAHSKLEMSKIRDTNFIPKVKTKLHNSTIFYKKYYEGKDKSSSLAYNGRETSDKRPFHKPQNLFIFLAL